VGRRSHNRRARRARAWIAQALFALLPFIGCGPSAPAEPPGAWWAGRASVVRGVLAQIEELDGTPLARRARELAAALPECESVGVHAPDGDVAKLAEGARCLGEGDPLERIRRASGSDLVFAMPASFAQRAEGGRRPSGVRGETLRGALRLENGALALDLRWPDPPADGALRLLVPGDAPAGPDRLASTGRLVSLRVRPRAGLDLAALVPEDSQADRLFRLGSGILAAAVLDGTWEGAVYLPERTSGMPGIALALGFSVRSAAVAAIEHLIADLQQTWPVHRSELRGPAGDGACLPDLNVLPELAPCYVATADSLVVGWNAMSLQRALAGAHASRSPQGREAVRAPQVSRSETKASEGHRGGEAERSASPRETEASEDHPTGGTPDAPARLDLDLALIQRADDLLARAFPGSQPPPHWPWSRLLASGGDEDGALVLRVTLLPRSAS
jgi:hypothetical protein